MTFTNLQQPMKILFLSDIHGSIASTDTVLDYFDAHGYDLLVLLGDLLNYGPRNGLFAGLDAKAVAERLGQYRDRVVAVRGNCDSEVDQMLLPFPTLGDYAIVADGPTRFFVTHGHIYNEKQLPAGPACDVLIYGHTHLWKLQPADPVAGRPVIANTGSPTFPKQGNPPTFITWEEGALTVLTLNGAPLASLRP